MSPDHFDQWILKLLNQAYVEESFFIKMIRMRRNDERKGTLFRKQSFEYFNFDYFDSFQIELPANYGKPLKIISYLRFHWFIPGVAIIDRLSMSHKITDSLDSRF